MKKLVSLLLVLMLCMPAAFAGTMAPAGTFPVVEGEPETLTILVTEDPLVVDHETNAFTKYIEENCNVNLEFKLLPAGEAASKLQVMVTSGETLPDVICYGIGYTTLDAYAKAGAIIPLDDLYEEYSVNFKAQVEAHPELQLLEQVTAPDGHIYAIPRYFVELNNIYKYRMWVCHEWLDNLGLEMPTTIDEFYEMLVAFKEEDANGNGDPHDEIPLSGANSGTWLPTTFIMNSFVYANLASDYRYVQDGQVTVSYIQDGWKEGLKFLNKLAVEGLLDTNCFTQTSTQLKAQTYNDGDTRIVGAYTVQNLAQSEPAKSYTGAMPFEGPEGVQYAVYDPTTASRAWMITKDCANPELAFRVGDFCFTEDAFLRDRVGEEGVSWVAASEEDVSIFPDLYDATFVWLDNEFMWANSQNSIWRQQAPLFALNGLNARAAGDTLSYGSKTNYETIQKLASYGPDMDMVLGFVAFTDEESKAINDIAATLKSFAQEYMVLFITGELDIDAEWDNYIAELYNIGLQEYLDIYQAAYERTQG